MWELCCCCIGGQGWGWTLLDGVVDVVLLQVRLGCQVGGYMGVLARRQLVAPWGNVQHLVSGHSMGSLARGHR
jgi:hypothetical protein